jgi:DNA-binding transcriptional regulator YiaG
VKAKTPAQMALLAMRDKLYLTQQELAAAMGVTSVSVCRWETSRSPAGMSLLRLFLFARRAGARQAAGVFQEALAEELRREFIADEAK